MRICLIEAVRKQEDAGSIGVYFIEQAVKRAGHVIERIPWDSQRYCYDVELISVHHPSDYSILQKIPRHAKIRIIGGHVTYTNPRPVIPLCDALCLGDGEEWIVNILSKIDRDRRYFETIDALEGGILTRTWQKGEDIPSLNFLTPLPLNNPPYLNNHGELNAAWYIEITRGCPFRCAYCEVGHAMPCRHVQYPRIMEQLDTLDRLETDRIVFFASDEASHPEYAQIVQAAKDRGFRQVVGLYRLDQIQRHGLTFPRNQLIKVGIDGLTEATRHRVGKRLKDDGIYQYFKTMTGRGHVFFKAYQMFGYPWECLKDFDQFESLMSRILALPVSESVKLLIKWAPLIPRPKTPLERESAQYDTKMVKRIKAWHSEHAKPKHLPGWFVEIDQGIQSRATHKRHCQYFTGDETALIHNAVWVHPIWRKK